jgi:NDP-sugar pyrophosphorylase family protein
MNILFPIAGHGTRFKSKGFNEPKPFIKIKDKYIIEYAISSLKLRGKYFIITRLLEEKYENILKGIANKYMLDIEIIDIGRDTSGQAETCFLICDKIDLSEELIITNCDQYTPWDSNKFLDFTNNINCDGIVSIYKHYDVEINKPGDIVI